MSAVAVLGGGLAGLVAARSLARAGADVTVYEQRDEVGGRVRSVHEDGYVYDRGFQVLFTSYPAARRELDFDALDLRTFDAGATIARTGSRSVLADPRRHPTQVLDLLMSSAVGIGDAIRLFKLWRDVSADATLETIGRSETTIERYLDRRGFSRPFVEDVIAPFFGGITLDRSLSTASGIFEYLLQVLATGRGAIPASGMGEIPAQIARDARDAGARIELDARASAIDATDDEVELTVGGETVVADAAVVATDPLAARELTGIESIPTDTLGCVTQYYSKPSASVPEMGKRLHLNVENAAPNQVAPLSAVASDYAPVGQTLLSATFLEPTADDEATLAVQTRDALGSWYPEADFGDLTVRRTDRIEFAQFAQPPGFRASLPEQNAPAGPVVLAGDYTRWSSIQGALESGAVAADLLRSEHL
jgi:hypothetical protein